MRVFALALPLPLSLPLYLPPYVAWLEFHASFHNTPFDLAVTNCIRRGVVGGVEYICVTAGIFIIPRHFFH